MSHTCFIQIRDQQWVNINCATAFYGFELRGYEIVPFTREEVHSIPVTADTVVVGEIATTKHALREAGYEPPETVGVPERLLPLLKRATWTSTLGEVQQLFNGGEEESLHRPLFIKPRDTLKTFTGHVISNMGDLLTTAYLPAEMPVIVQEAVDFVSEWRCFVQEGRIIHMARYHGAPLMFPDISVAMEAMDLWGADAPIAYSVDIGVIHDQGTALVELNDGFSLGCYGMDGLTYSHFVEARWKEMTHPSRRLRECEPGVAGGSV